MEIKPVLTIWTQIHSYIEDIYMDMKERPDLFNLNGNLTVGKFKDETSGNVITESYHIQAKSYHYVLADKSTQSKYKRVSKRGMSKMATDSYISTLEGSLLDDLIDKSQNKKLRIWLCVLRQIL